MLYAYNIFLNHLSNCIFSLHSPKQGVILYKHSTVISLSKCHAVVRFDNIADHTPYLFSSVIAYAGTYHHYYHPDYSTVGTPVDQAAEIYARMMAEKKFFDGSIIGTLIKNADIIRSSVKIALHVGTKDVLYCDNEILHLHLDTLQIPHEYKKYEGADHNLSLIVY